MCLTRPLSFNNSIARQVSERGIFDGIILGSGLFGSLNHSGGYLSSNGTNFNEIENGSYIDQDSPVAGLEVSFQAPD